MATPAELRPIRWWRRRPEPASVDVTTDPREAAAGADAVYTDVWVSMGDDRPRPTSAAALLAPYRARRRACWRGARRRAIALHCLPAHPGEEIEAEVLYGTRSAVFDQAENRLHAQKALMEMLIGLG